MSSFIVDDKVIDRILYSLNAYGRKKTLGSALSRVKDSEGLYYTFDDVASLSRLGNALLNMNGAAYATRYREPQTLRTDYKFKVRFQEPGDSLPSLYKNISSFLYQCIESDAIVESDLFRAVKALKADVAHEIISDLPEYKATSWSGR